MVQANGHETIQLVLLLAALAGGCEQGPPVRPYEHGNRLRVSLDMLEDLGRVRGVYDTKLEVTCTPGLVVDGSLRCVPDGARVQFADAECERRVAVYPANESPSFAREVDVAMEGTCELSGWSGGQVFGRTRSFRVGDEIEPQPVFALDAAGECVEVDIGSAALKLGEITEELEPDGMVLLSLQETPLSDEVASIHLMAEDGFRIVVGARDLVQDAPCEPARFADGRVRCAPLQAQQVGAADSRCTHPAYSVTGGATCARPSLVTVCDRIFVDRCEVYELGPEVESLYVQSDQRCDAFTDIATLLADGMLTPGLLGERLDDDAFPVLEEVVSRRGENGLSVWSVDRLPVTAKSTFFSSRGDCEQREVIEEIEESKEVTISRCVPAIPHSATYFADADCETRLTMCNGLTPPGAVFVVANANGGTIWSAREVGPPMFLGQVFQVNDSGCERVNAPGPFCALGELVEPDAFPKLTKAFQSD